MHLQIISEFVNFADNGHSLQFPFGVDLICENGGFVFIERKEPIEYNYRLTFGENPVPGRNCKIFVENENSASPIDAYKNIYKIVKRIKISSDIIKNNICVRNRADGDSIKYGNMTHSVKKILSEKKVPSSCRPDYPVIYDSEGLLFVPPYAVRDGIRGDEKFYITYCE